jgi:hypothetical protein
MGGLLPDLGIANAEQGADRGAPSRVRGTQRLGEDCGRCQGGWPLL